MNKTLLSLVMATTFLTSCNQENYNSLSMDYSGLNVATFGKRVVISDPTTDESFSYVVWLKENGDKGVYSIQFGDKEYQSKRLNEVANKDSLSNIYQKLARKNYEVKNE